ncbi:MAG: phosphatase PAP2 family protein [Bacteroides sp.]|nr:phosphatase PAP2 family protein [Bacteroides sp.]
MALELFKKVETKKGLFAVEKVTLIYNLLTSILILFLFQEMDHPVRMLADRLSIATMTFLLMYLYRLAPCKFAAFIRIAVQMSLLSYWYPDTFEFNRVFPNLDHLFAAAEQWCFGGQPAVNFCLSYPQLWVSELFNMGYFFYYPMILLVVVWYFLFRFDLFEKVSFVIVTAFFIYYLIYIFVPVAGPQFYFPAIGDECVARGVFPAIGDYFHHNQVLLPGQGCQEGFFYSLVEGSQQVGERPTAAFPSSHVGMSTMLMIMAWRGSKLLFFFLAPFYLLLCGATVYIQAHYVIDAIVGFVSAFALYILVTWMFKRWFAEPMFGGRVYTPLRTIEE